MAILRLFTMLAIIMFIAALALSEQHIHKAQAFPCIGDANKEYCIGYHSGAIQAHRDYNSGDDNNIGSDQQQCKANPEYCKGYDRGYNDEADFLG